MQLQGGIAFLGIISTIAGVCPFLTLILSRAFLDSLARACGQQAFEMEIIWLLFFLFLTNMMLSVVNNLSILLKSEWSDIFIGERTGVRKMCSLADESV